MAFTAQDVAKLREQTGAGMMDCKKALIETDGDMGNAAKFLREQGINVAAKKAGRIASEGVVSAAVSKDFKTGALVEINCESDFVGKSDAFTSLAKEIAAVIVEKNPKDNDALLSIKTADGTVTELINNATAKIGEKLSLRRFVRSAVKEGREEFYLHMGGKIGVLAEFETDRDLNGDESFVTLCHDVAMHIAAASPEYVRESEVSADYIAEQREIFIKQVINEGKPEAVAEKIVGGKLKKFLGEICLLEQPFVKDPSQSVGKLVETAAKNLGAAINIVKFTKFVMGEGLEKKTDNLAEEVAKMQSK
jgi:elongation factor Ts